MGGHCCDEPAEPPAVQRRHFLRTAATLALAGPLLPAFATTALAAPEASDALGGLRLHPRADWAGKLNPVGKLSEEAPDDVRFLLVHHTASGNDYAATDVPGLISGFYSAHTTRKGWPDVAYNFFVDRYGGIWEGRAGSIRGPVIADATGGNQGFSQLCCLIGDHQKQPPTDEARHSLAQILAALANRYNIDTATGATTSFVSRGSNRWPAGKTVTTDTIAGHRDMSQTICPGDAAYPLIRTSIRSEVNAVRAATTSPPPSAAITQVPAAVTPAPAATSAPAPGTKSSAPTGTSTVLAIGAGTAVMGALLAVVLRRRRVTAGSLSTGASESANDSPPTTRLPRGTLARWEAVAADSSGNAQHLARSPAAMIERRPDILIGAIAGTAGSNAEAAACIERCRALSRDLPTQPADATNALDLAIELLAEAQAPDADGIRLAVAVVLPSHTAIVATDTDLAVMMTADGAVYRPRSSRSDTRAQGRPVMLHTALATSETAAVLLSGPSNVPTNGSARNQLPALARDAVTWPSLQLGANNFTLRSAAESGLATALVTMVNRECLIRVAATKSLIE